MKLFIFWLSVERRLISKVLLENECQLFYVLMIHIQEKPSTNSFKTVLRIYLTLTRPDLITLL